MIRLRRRRGDLLLAAFHAVIDAMGLRRRALPPVVVGVNTIATDVVPRLVKFDQTA